MKVTKLAKIPGMILTRLQSLATKENPEAIYCAIVHAWLCGDNASPDADEWLDYLQRGLENCISYDPAIFHDEEGYEEFLGEVVGIVDDNRLEFNLHFARIIPEKEMEMSDVEFNGISGEVTFHWVDEVVV